MIRAAFGVLLAVCVGGCAGLDRSAISYKPIGTETSPQRLFVWRSNYSAGVSSQGGICVQAATTARAMSAELDVAANTALLKALVPTLAAAGNEEAAKASAAIRQSVMLTNATSGQTAYANIAYFYLCQISQNKNLSSDQVVSMWSEVTKTVPQIGAPSMDTSNIASPGQKRDDQAGGQAKAAQGPKVALPPGADAPAAPIVAPAPLPPPAVQRQ